MDRKTTAAFGGALLASVALSAAGCSADAVAPGGDPGPDLGGNWRPFTPTPLESAGFVGGPAVCNAHNDAGAWVAFGRAGSNRFRWSIQERLYPATAWADLGVQTFNAKPACAALDDLYVAPPWNYQKVVVGKSAVTNHYTVRVMKIPPGAIDPATNLPEPTIPSLVSDWAEISVAPYASAPAATVADGSLVVCGRGLDNRVWCNASRIFMYSDDPYTGIWLPPARAPVLPVPWVAQGDPAIANTQPWLGSVTLAVRATRANPPQTALFALYYDTALNQFGGWSQFPTGTLGINSDPAMDVDVTRGWADAATLFFRGVDDRIYQGSGNLGWTAFGAFNAANNTNMGWTGAPAAAGSLNGWEGFHVVLAPKNGQFHQTAPCPPAGGC